MPFERCIGHLNTKDIVLDPFTRVARQPAAIRAPRDVVRDGFRHGNLHFSLTPSAKRGDSRASRSYLTFLQGILLSPRWRSGLVALTSHSPRTPSCRSWRCGRTSP